MDFEKIVDKHKDQITELSILGFNLGVEEGRKSERNRILKQIDQQICMEFALDESCEHSSCYVLFSTHCLIREGLK